MLITNTPTRSWTLPFAARGFTEGNPSNDGRYVAAFDNAQMCIVDMDPQPPLETYAQGNRRIGPPAPHDVEFPVATCLDALSLRSQFIMNAMMRDRQRDLSDAISG